ncbi:hypothetical protein [Rhodoligotrophos defluvii]|uniref:hypothetical protein n=1 Tax=Rhodoligotrophos defluvii TaxID=2561934 RepID=UPI0010C9F991|nr:hypothetical protein [Rhodoligotrophos defluvii]
MGVVPAKHWARTVRLGAAVLAAGLFTTAVPAGAADARLAAKARDALVRAATFYSGLSVRGSYVWDYAADLSVRKGEGKASPTTGWVQPPGTPAVGAAFLRVFEVTGDARWLDAARKAGEALVETQLISGGWYYSIETNRTLQSAWCYRARQITPEACEAMGENRVRNRTVLDDNNSQSALLFLIELDRALGGKDRAVHDALLYGLEKIAQAQYPSGAWPVMFDERPKMKDVPPAPAASLPDTWPRTWVKPEGGPYYILNDNLVRDTVYLFLQAERHFDNPAFLRSATRAGEFLLKAQLPKPQRGWAQTYDEKMQPVWGRKFEPPAVASRETAGAIACLIELYGRTGDARLLDSAKEAADWLRSVQLPDGDWARFYELGTNRALYMSNDEQLTYEAQDLLSHYGMKGRQSVPQALALVKEIDAGKPVRKRPPWPSVADRMTPSEVEERTRALVATLDGQGRWVEDGWIRSATFVDAVFVMAKFLDYAEDAP